MEWIRTEQQMALRKKIILAVGGLDEATNPDNNESKSSHALETNGSWIDYFMCGTCVDGPGGMRGRHTLSDRHTQAEMLTSFHDMEQPVPLVKLKSQLGSLQLEPTSSTNQSMEEGPDESMAWTWPWKPWHAVLVIFIILGISMVAFVIASWQNDEKPAEGHGGGGGGR